MVRNASRIACIICNTRMNTKPYTSGTKNSLPAYSFEAVFEANPLND